MNLFLLKWHGLSKTGCVLVSCIATYLLNFWHNAVKLVIFFCSGFFKINFAVELKFFVKLLLIKAADWLMKTRSLWLTHEVGPAWSQRRYLHCMCALILPGGAPSPNDRRICSVLRVLLGWSGGVAANKPHVIRYYLFKNQIDNSSALQGLFSKIMFWCLIFTMQGTVPPYSNLQKE